MLKPKNSGSPVPGRKSYPTSLKQGLTKGENLLKVNTFNFFTMLNRLKTSPVVRDPEPKHSELPSTTRGRIGMLAMLVMVGATGGCATTGSRDCRTELFTNTEQFERLEREGCKRNGKLTFKCCGSQAKGYKHRF